MDPNSALKASKRLTRKLWQERAVETVELCLALRGACPSAGSGDTSAAVPPIARPRPSIPCRDGIAGMVVARQAGTHGDNGRTGEICLDEWTLIAAEDATVLSKTVNSRKSATRRKAEPASVGAGARATISDNIGSHAKAGSCDEPPSEWRVIRQLENFTSLRRPPTQRQRTDFSPPGAQTTDPA
jgi:hypothetical protein